MLRLTISASKHLNVEFSSLYLRWARNGRNSRCFSQLCSNPDRSLRAAWRTCEHTEDRSQRYRTRCTGLRVVDVLTVSRGLRNMHAHKALLSIPVRFAPSFSPSAAPRDPLTPVLQTPSRTGTMYAPNSFRRCREVSRRADIHTASVPRRALCSSTPVPLVSIPAVHSTRRRNDRL